MSEAPAPGPFIARMRPAVLQAAAIAVALEGRVANRPKRGEATDVKAALTTADTASQEAILVALAEHFPGVCLEAEEDTPSVGRFPADAPARVVIDPIDGTLHSYLEGRGPYAVIVGLAIEERYEAALLALPREGLLLEGVRGGGVRVADADGAAQPARVLPDGPRVLVSHGTPAPMRARLEAAGFLPVPACGGAVAVAPLLPGICAGVRLGAPGSGVSVRSRVGAMIAREAGALLANERGGPFPDDLRTPAQALVVGADAASRDRCIEAIA